MAKGIGSAGAATRAALVAVLSLLSVAASAAPDHQFALSGLVAPCNVNNTGSCVKIDTSATWPPSQTFTVSYDLASIVGDTVPFQITDLFIPTLFGGLGDMDTFTITSTVDGTFDTATGFVDFSFDLVVSRNGLPAPAFTYTMTTGNNTVPSCAGNGSPVTIPGANHDPATNELSVVGNQCINIAPVGSPAEERYLQMSLTGTLPDPFAAPVIPVLSVWGTLLLGSGLLALAAARRRAL